MAQESDGVVVFDMAKTFSNHPQLTDLIVEAINHGIGT